MKCHHCEQGVSGWRNGGNKGRWDLGRMGLPRERLPGLGGRSEAPVEAGGRSAHSRTEERWNVLEKHMSRGEAGGVLSQATSCEARDVG